MNIAFIITILAIIILGGACLWMDGHNQGWRDGYKSALRNYEWALKDHGVRTP